MTRSRSTTKAGLLHTTRKVYRREGIRAFYMGFSPAIVRGLFYGGVRLGIQIEFCQQMKDIDILCYLKI